MSVEGILADAQGANRSFRFRADWISPNGLEQLAGEVAGNPNLWRHAKAQFRGSCVKAAANRLKNKAFLDAHPEIASRRSTGRSSSSACRARAPRIWRT